MFAINEVKIQRILNPTNINLGEYVINPYMGCEYSCLYCYVRSNRIMCKKGKTWGTFLDVRINAPFLLEKELKAKRVGTVLMGSTTECFQPADKKYNITGKILEILNNHKVYYVILTRSPLILDYIDLLKGGFCKKIYFTVNNFLQNFKDVIEPKSPMFDLRIKAINAFINEKIPVIPYFSPLLPWISNFDDVFPKLKNARSIEFECLNFRLKNINEIINKIGEVDIPIMEKYKTMAEDKIFYYKVWEEIRNQIELSAKKEGMDFNIHTHDFGSYFENKYS